MAKTPVKFNANGIKEREVMMVTYSYNQATDKEGQVTGIPRGGKITIRVKALNTGDSDLWQWMIDQDEHKTGSVDFMDAKTNISQIMKSIRFEDAYCVEYREFWGDKVGDGDNAHYEEFVLSCRIIENSKGGRSENEWA